MVTDYRKATKADLLRAATENKALCANFAICSRLGQKVKVVLNSQAIATLQINKAAPFIKRLGLKKRNLLCILSKSYDS